MNGLVFVAPKCLRKHMNKHVNGNPLMHLAMACDTVVSHTDELRCLSDLLTTTTLQIKHLHRRMDHLEKLHGSQCVWKIQWFQDKQDAAKCGNQTTIFSPSFMTSRHGYKMVLSLCPYGDGKSRGKFLSIFICICKGDYDALLQWPFHHRVTLTLIDQCPDPQYRRNATFTIKPKVTNGNKTFLGQPTGPRNPSFGSQQFVELSLLDTMDYVRNDVMFIKCTVDREDMLLL
ncbi:TNF receptor-associated factor 2-like [Gigantopelta aegis]|uniref:TNF receptor-associated factor 2-like n=1 Tax=Gigantopelta aegis TaxID=1735272 RepID=UPI001B88B16D|nr:TNF receptor-associated factor 2-like [Gigantopelta aegis]